MVGGDAGPNQAVRGRQAVIQVDGELRVVARQQLSRGVEAARSGADDRGTKGLGHSCTLQPELGSGTPGIKEMFVARDT